MKKIEVFVPRSGISAGKTQVKVETTGFTGTNCQAVTEGLQKALGGSQQEELTGEYYEQEQGIERLHEGGSGG